MSRFQVTTRLLWVAIAFAILYNAWVFYERRAQDQQFRQRQLEKQREADRRAVELMGGDRFEILQFYASPGMIRRGESALLCYGVSNTKSVKIEPPAGPVWPAQSRCVEVSPRRDTTYTLTAENAAGKQISKSVTLKVE
jgi:hypothetical protein